MYVLGGTITYYMRPTAPARQKQQLLRRYQGSRKPSVNSGNRNETRVNLPI